MSDTQNGITPRLAPHQRAFLTGVLEADHEFNDDPDSPYLGWTGYDVSYPDGEGGRALITITHESVEDSDTGDDIGARIVTTGTFELVYVSGEVGTKAAYDARENEQRVQAAREGS